MDTLPTKVAKSSPGVENLKKLSTEKGGKFKFSAQGQDLASFVANVSKVRKPFEIKPPLFVKFV